ncbi:3-oxoadipate enol-lactonase 2 OS=Afipia felis OX=1035 GN=catD_3 PE=4 SV=1 [Afipia felis]
MAIIEVDGCAINVQVDGRKDAPPLMFSNSMGCSLEMWQPQMAALTQKFRVIRYDRRGHGKSAMSNVGYSVERFGKDAIAILDHLGVTKTHWCGISLGGVVGQWMAATAPERIDRLVLSNTTSYVADPTNWLNRIKAIQESGLASIADAVLAGWLTEEFRQHHPDVVTSLREALVSTDLGAYAGCCATLSRLDQRELLPLIGNPTLIIAGEYDKSTPIPAAELLKSRIPDTRMEIIKAAHISNIEAAGRFNELVLSFLE